MTETRLSRRQLLQASAALGITGAVPSGHAAATESTPDLEKFVQPLPIPTVREPDGDRDGADYYEISIQEFEQQVHPDLPPTTFWGFDETVPGPSSRYGATSESSSASTTLTFPRTTSSKSTNGSAAPRPRTITTTTVPSRTCGR